MADTKGVKDGLKAVGDVVPALALLGTLSPFILPIVDFVGKKIDDHKEEQKDLVEIPILYSKDIYIELDRAVTLLEGYGLKVEPFAIRKEKIKFKDCFNTQVVGTNPKQKHKVKPGTLIYVKYVSADIIEKSQILFEETERRKAEVKLKKVNEKLERKETVKKIINDTAAIIQEGASGLTDNVKIQIEKLSVKKNQGKESIETSNDEPIS